MATAVAACAVAFLFTFVWSFVGNETSVKKAVLLFAYGKFIPALDTRHDRYADAEKSESLQVQVISTGGIHLIQETSDVEGEKNSKPFTDRVALRKLIQAIADQEPKAIGVDIDFSSESDVRPVSRRDTGFFMWAKKLRSKQGKGKPIPVYLGVYNRREGQGNYLGVPEFDTLAAAIPVSSRNSLYMPIRMGTSPDDLPCLAYKVAYGNTRHVFGFGTVTEVEGRDSVLTNYSQLEDIMGSALTDVSPETIPQYKEYIKDRYILLGDAAQTPAPEDKFRTPRQRALVPGVFLHACAVYTLLQEPLAHMPDRWRLILLNLVVIAGVPFLIYRVNRLHKKEEKERLSWESTFFGIAATVVAFLGGALVFLLKFFWFDALLISSVFAISAFCFKYLPLLKPHTTPS